MQQATGWPGRQAGGCGVHTRSSIKLFSVEMESALFVLGARGLGARGHACWCCRRGSGLTGEPPPGCWGLSTPSSAIPAAFRPSWWVQSWTPAPTHLTSRLSTSCGTWAPEASLGPQVGGGPHRPPCGWCGSQSATQSSPGPRPDGTSDPVPDWSLEVPSALRTVSRVALNVGGSPLV